MLSLENLEYASFERLSLESLSLDEIILLLQRVVLSPNVVKFCGMDTSLLRIEEGTN
jgi:hypothetical protein